MAKSKNGGTRAYIRGRIGSDVYSVGKDGAGKKQQVVRSLAESVGNPRTSSQMFGRMIMSTVMQAVSSCKFIIDHSFDGVPSGQPSISEFIRRNYQLVKEDALAHPSEGNYFGLNQFQERGMKAGMYCMSIGSATFPSAMTANDGAEPFKITVGENPTFGSLIDAWALGSDEYVTLLTFGEDPTPNVGDTVSLYAIRLKIKSGLDRDTALTALNALSCFDTEGDMPLRVVLDDGVLALGYANDDSLWFSQARAIVTRKQNGAFVHSTLFMRTTAGQTYSADEALPTYPIGVEQFLNGGDL